jgi:hypothetical protein
MMAKLALVLVVMWKVAARLQRGLTLWDTFIGSETWHWLEALTGRYLTAFIIA